MSISKPLFAALWWLCPKQLSLVHSSTLAVLTILVPLSVVAHNHQTLNCLLYVLHHEIGQYQHYKLLAILQPNKLGLDLKTKLLHNIVKQSRVSSVHQFEVRKANNKPVWSLEKQPTERNLDSSVQLSVKKCRVRLRQGITVTEDHMSVVRQKNLTSLTMQSQHLA